MVLNLVNAFVFGLAALIWTKNNWANFMVKAVLLGLTIANVVVAVRQ